MHIPTFGLLSLFIFTATSNALPYTPGSNGGQDSCADVQGSSYAKGCGEDKDVYNAAHPAPTSAPNPTPSPPPTPEEPKDPYTECKDKLAALFPAGLTEEQQQYVAAICVLKTAGLFNSGKDGRDGKGGKVKRDGGDEDRKAKREIMVGPAGGYAERKRLAELYAEMGL